MTKYIRGQIFWYQLTDELPFKDDISELTELARKDNEFKKLLVRDDAGRYKVFAQSLIIASSPESEEAKKLNQDTIIFEPSKDENHLRILQAMRNKAAFAMKKKERLTKIINYMVCEQDQKKAIRETNIDLRLCHKYLAALSKFEHGSTEIDDLMMDVGRVMTENIQYNPAPTAYEYEYENSREESSYVNSSEESNEEE